ncbi:MULTISPECIES: DUF5977 domain-containing protein [unclassified Flavobacterium]|uniref:DUF5977 domain-containing protein n=1 Tax=unclassified Flavobacterium TaxID=196869 RepID=UPI000EB4C5A9|nr:MULTISPECIES: DUF5977 domain-containing protein [unclassified Flavobacterium]
MIILISSTKAIAQNDFVPKIVPPSPEAASLGKFVEVPVSHYTGLPNISVPLYTIESGEIKLPIQVSYHARGIQVSEMAPQVGTGWALSAGGVITRQQRGPADESTYGYLSENFYDTFYTSEATRVRVQAQSLTGIDSDKLMDMEPDVYFFNFLNFSGKFIFDQKTKKPVIQKYSDFKIEPKFENGYYITGWVITDKDGIKYYFGTSKDGARKAIDSPEGSSSYQFLAQKGLQKSTVNITYNNAWQLMDIVTPSNKEIKFEYLKERPDYFSRSFDDGQGFYLTSHFSKIFMNQYHIKTITFDKGKVVFTKFATQREDLRNSYALQKVEVFGSDGLLKVKHSFNYTYTNSEDTNSLLHLRNSEPQAKKRLFLESIVSEGSKTTNKGKKYSFVYDSQILPNRFSTAQDNWGYYNGKDNGEYSSFFEGDNREVDTIKSQAGMLKKIIYPTGGSATFEYEHNIVIPPLFYQELLMNPTTPSEHKVANIIKDSLRYDSTRGVFVSKSFTVTLGKESDIVNAQSFSSFAGDISTCSSTMTNYGCPFEVSVYKLNPKTSMGSLFIGRGSIRLDSGEYVIEVRPKTPEGRDLTDYEKGAFSVSLSWEQPSSNPKEILFAAGKRIKRIIWDDNLGGITSKSYKYLDSSGKSSGKTFSIPNMYYIMGMYNNSPIINQIGATAGSPLTNFQGNALGYSVVTEINGEAGNNIGKTEYNFTMPEDSGDFYKFPYHSPTDNEWLRGMPLSIKYYSNNAGSYSLVKEVKNKYIYGDVMTDVRYMAEMLDSEDYLLHRRKYIFPLAIFTASTSSGGSVNYDSPNSYNKYYTMGGTVDLFSTEETEFLKNAKEYKKSTKYFYNYNSNYELKSSQTQTSSQETLETKYFYAPDPEMAGEPFRSDLIAKNMIGIPLDTQTFNIQGTENVKLSEQKTVYDNSAATSNLLLPKYIYSNKGTDDISITKDEKIAFDKYDDRGNVLQYTPKGGVPVSIIWGYNKTQPIAKIENITYDKIVNSVDDLQKKSNADIDNGIATISTEQVLRESLKKLRKDFPDYMITTYTYDPSMGVTSITDPKEKTIYYEYDSFGRLKFVKNNEFNVLEKYCYNYKGEQTDCSDDSDSAGVLYRSAALNGSFTRNDCGEGVVGSTVSFSLPAEAIISLVSQADADAQAQMQFNSEGQAYANTNGTCTFTSIAKSGSFTKNNCSGGAVGSAVVYNVPAGRYTSTISQDAADALAQTEVNSKGQANANTNGICTFSNIAKTGSYTKNNCVAGGVGSTVVYTVSAGSYTSTTSQAAADALAQTDVTTNGQTYANTNGTCTFSSIARSGSFTKNNCASGGVGSSVAFNQAVGAQTSIISQADADAKGLTLFNTNGQANANTNGTCTFSSVVKSGSFTKNNCVVGGVGSAVVYTVPAGTYTSTTSQAAADALAQTDVNNNGQANANTNGICTFFNVAKSGSFTRNNCTGGMVGSVEIYTVAAGSYASTTSQAAADALAQTAVNNNGQSYANSNGRCLFKSVAKSKTLTKNDCTGGSTGSVETYALAAGAYSSEISQADADKKAQDVIDALAQSYVNDIGTCLFYSVVKSGSFTKNNCAAGGVGSVVVYTVPAKQYSSAVSQAAADALAQTDVNNNGQAYANTNGTCTFSSIVKSGSFTKNNCAAGGAGSAVIYTVPAGRYTSTTSQAAADALAQTDVNNNGQANANTNGTCTFSSIARSGSFTKNNCASGGVGSSVAFSQAVGAQTSIISQADADAKGLTLFNTNGQANANTNGTCTFTSVVKSGSFTKNNCAAGGAGSVVVYTVPAGSYTSTTSQAAADALAQTDVTNNGQANANTNGTCTFSSIARSGNFTKNNCASGGVPSSVAFSQAVGAQTSLISQADADSKGLTLFNTNGQANANTNGTCTFSSIARSGNFTKNNCASGGVGSSVAFSQVVGAQTSIISQADADAKGLTLFNTNGQANANTNGTCTFSSVVKSGSFTKNNCAAGGVGSAVVYTVPAGTYTSTTSQAAADALAQTDVNNNGQANANTNGICTFSNIAKSGNFTRNNCIISGTVGSVETYTVAAGSYTSTVSQAAADALAQTAVNNNGQNYANSNGKCLFKSIAKSKTLTKNDCTGGSTGSVETYALAAGAYSSEISQADADKKAQDVIDALAQSYVNDIGTCLFYSIVKSGSFTKNNCAAGGVGSVVVYTVPAKQYSSAVSQAAADALAQTDVNNNGQAYANTNGTCTFTSIVKSGSFTKNNCAAGGVGSAVIYTVPAGRYTSTTSQAAADALAQTDVNNNGQANANTNGTCTFSSIARSGNFTKNNCAAGGVGSSVAFSQAVGAQTSIISQADADAKGLTLFNTNGQANANTNGTCTFTSVVKSGSFTKNNCAAGGAGSVVVYTVPAGSYTSTTSQAAADALAQTDVTNNGQANANTNGTCTFSSIVRSGNFTRNNCAAGGVASTVAFSQAVGAQTSLISQADADSKGLTLFNTNGQANANTNGTCTFSSIARSGNFTKNNCASGGVGSSVAFSQVVGAQTSIISQADADAKGLTLFNTNGQANANTNGTCTFNSVVKSGSFTKNNCAAGGVGSAVVYTVPAGTYTSTTSQAAADALAQTDVNNNGQANANTNGICTFSSIAKSGTFTRNNCTGSTVGSVETYTVAAGSYTSTVSQAAADALAQTAVNNNGQSYANSVGRCLFKSIAKSKTLTKNDCTGGSTGSVETFSLPAGAYSSEISQADADKKAQDVIDATAQSYVNDIGTCLFYSVAKSGSFTKNNCSGGTASTVVYTVPARQYNSAVSQAAADALAQTDVNNNGQAYANANGTCTFYNVLKSATYTRNNCGATAVSSGSVVYTVAAGKYSSVVSQAAADNLAQDELNANGQNTANTQGICTFKNVLMSKVFTKAGCPVGYDGTMVSYSVAAGLFTSTISQADADAKALAELNSKGQANANAKGSCLLRPDEN